MQKMPDNVTFDQVNDHVVRTAVRLMHDPMTAQLAQPLMDVLERYGELNVAANRLRNPATFAQEWMEMGRKPIVDDIRDLELDAERVVHRHFAEEPYHTLFGTYNVAAHAKMEPKALKEEIKNKTDEIGKLPDDSILRPHIPILQKLVRDWNPLVKKYDEAQSSLDGANAAVATELANIAELLGRTHAAVEAVYPTKKKVVEAFFEPWTTPRQPKTETPPANNPPAPNPAPAPAPAPAPVPPSTTAKNP